jgi:hypothetical protein
MLEFHFTISFLRLESIKVKVKEANSHVDAITKALKNLTDEQKKQVIGTKITYIGDAKKKEAEV